MAHLLFDSCDTVALARKYGTPLYLLSERLVRERLRMIRTEFMDSYTNTDAVFASKALQTLEVCRIVAQEGLGLDVVSGGELFAAAKAGFPMERIYFHGNSKTSAELEMAVDHGVGRIVVDNLDELEQLDAIARSRGIRQAILFRINPGVDSHTHEYISTGHVDSKFGMPLDPAVRDEYLGQALAAEGVQLLGFHFHVGSQLHSNESHRKATEAALGLMKDARDRYGFIARELNLGGGFGIRYNDEDEVKPLRYFTDALMQDIRQQCALLGLDVPKVIIEPGRWIVAEAGITLYTVGSVKAIPGLKTYVGVDGGMPDNPRPALYDARYEASIADRHDDERDTLVTVAGKCCESGDILIKDIALQSPRRGDILAVFTTGAYNHSMASNYNRLPRPAMVLVDAGADRLSVRRETFEDLVAREL
ncbi:MAG: diaminopimelate decarboxylase [Spirochaetota bacterium]